jgi:hypothetical protein
MRVTRRSLPRGVGSTQIDGERAQVEGDRKRAVVAGVLFLTAIVAVSTIAGSQTRMALGTVCIIVMSFSGAGIAIALYPVLRRHGEGMALGAVCFRTIEAVIFLVAGIAQFSLLALSERYLAAGPAQAASLGDIGAWLLEARVWLFSSAGAIAFCLGALLYYWIFFRSRLLPRWLSVWGLIAIVMHLAMAVSVLFGPSPDSATANALNLPIFLNEIVLGVWLIVKGFDRSPVAV